MANGLSIAESDCKFKMTGGGQHGRFSRRSKQESPDSKAADGGASTTDERSNLAASDTSSYSGLRRRARDGDMVIMETYCTYGFNLDHNYAGKGNCERVFSLAKKRNNQDFCSRTCTATTPRLASSWAAPRGAGPSSASTPSASLPLLPPCGDSSSGCSTRPLTTTPRASSDTPPSSGTTPG